MQEQVLKIIQYLFLHNLYCVKTGLPFGTPLNPNLYLITYWMIEPYSWGILCNFGFSERITTIVLSFIYCWACCVLFKTLHPSCGPAGSSFSGLFFFNYEDIFALFTTHWLLGCDCASFPLLYRILIFLQTTAWSSCHFLLHCLLFNIIIIIIIWNLDASATIPSYI